MSIIQHVVLAYSIGIIVGLLIMVPIYLFISKD